MKNSQRTLRFGLAAAILTLASWSLLPKAVVQAADMPTVGSMAPDFTLSNNDGELVKLSQYRGKWVVLYFYPADFTSGCTMEAHNFQADLDKFTAKNAVILGVSVQDIDSHKKFCTQEGLHFHLLADTERKVSALYGTLSARPMGNYGVIDQRVTFIVDPSGKIAKVYPKVNPAVHSGEVLAALDELQK